MKRPLTLSMILLCLPLTSFSQQPAAGLPAFGSFDSSGFDAINRQDLNVNFAIPVMSSPGRGGSLSHAIANNSLLWSRQGSTAWTPVTDLNGNPTWGWRIEPVVGSILYDTWTDVCDPGTGLQEFATFYFGYRYVDPAGTVHSFPIQFDDIATSCAFSTGPRTDYSLDMTGYYLDATVPYAPVIKDSAGRNVKTTGSAVDANGNSITATVVSSTVTQWKDSAGHVALIVDKTTSPYIDLKYLDNTGAYQTVRVTLQSFNIKTNFGCSGVVEYTGTANLPVSVTLPNGKQYQFTYEATPGFSTYTTARVKRVTLPTSGYYEYAYSGSNDGAYCSDGSVLNLSRTINDGVSSTIWQFARTPPGTSWTTTVTAPQLTYDPAANQSVYSFDATGHETSEKFYQGSAASGTLLRTINRTWAANGTPASQVTILENNQQNKTEMDYDSNSNLTALREFDWGTGAPGSLVRNTTLTYLSTSAYTTRNILNRVTQQIVKDGTGAIKSRTDIAYDAGGAFSGANCITGAAQHDDTNYGCSLTTRGNSTSTTTYTDPLTPAGAITKSFTYDSLGNLRTAQLNCCQQEQFNYSSTTQYAYPDSVVRGVSPTQLTTSLTYNSYTGLVVTSTDENGKATSFVYDTLKRLTSITRPDSTQITYTFDDTARTSTVDIPTQGTDKLRSITYVDPLGRVYKQTSSDASGGNCSADQTQFDTLGRAYKTSNPYDCAGSPAYWTERRFDGLGRTTKTIPPDGSAISNNTSFAYAGPSVTVTDPAGKQKKTQADGLGRLVTAYEPDVANGNQLTQQTTYTYNVFDGLTLVTQGAQTRTLVYDALGRLTDSTTPEAGHFQFQYNSFNLVTQRTDARGVITTYGYDTLNRIASVSYNVGSTGVPATSTVSYTYGTSSASNNNGRLLTLTDGVGTETYGYDNLRRTTQVQKVISGTTYTTSYAYNLASELTSITYPSGRVVLQSYDAIGRLCAVGASGSTCSTGTTYASGFSYNKAFQVTGFNYGNGVAATFSFSVDRLQLSSLAYTKSPSTLFSLNYWYKTDATNCPSGSSGNNGQIQCITDNVDSGVGSPGTELEFAL